MNPRYNPPDGGIVKRKKAPPKRIKHPKGAKHVARREVAESEPVTPYNTAAVMAITFTVLAVVIITVLMFNSSRKEGSGQITIIKDKVYLEDTAKENRPLSRLFTKTLLPVTREVHLETPKAQKRVEVLEIRELVTREVTCPQNIYHFSVEI